MPPAEGLGRWQATPWYGAVLPLPALSAAVGDPADAVEAFVKQNVDTAIELLESAPSA